MYIAPALFGLLVFEAELDLSSLPPKGQFGYEVRIELETAAGDKFDTVFQVSKDGSPVNLQTPLFMGLKGLDWTVRKDGGNVVVTGKGKSRIKKVKISSSNVGIGVRWIQPKGNKE